MKTNIDFHTSVLLDEALSFLRVIRGEKYIDATLGGGGHAREITKRGGVVLGIDQDQKAIDYAGKKFEIKAAKGNFRNIDNLGKFEGFGKVKGIIYDLGLSAFQIGDKTRGFSFQKEAPLDMRMDVLSSKGIRALDLINLSNKNELYETFSGYGEEARSRAISNAIVRARRVKAIESTGDLLKIIKGVYGIKGDISDKRKSEIAKRVFQALRIAVNDELNALKESLPKALNLLDSEGRIVVISFHSLEDRIVKENFETFEMQGLGRIITRKPVLPSEGEIKRNPSARSAKLRVFEKGV